MRACVCLFDIYITGYPNSVEVFKYYVVSEYWFLNILNNAVKPVYKDRRLVVLLRCLLVTEMELGRRPGFFLQEESWKST